MLRNIYDESVLWQMNAAERMALHYMFDRMPTKHKAIEIGSYHGGCTRLLAREFETVVSIDIDHSTIVDKDSYTNVEWCTGDSRYVLSAVLKKHQDTNFILIDGDHSYNGVMHDLSTCLHYNLPTKPIILLHDAAYEETHNAIEIMRRSVESLYFVDVDFVPGVPFHKGGLIGGMAIFWKK